MNTIQITLLSFFTFACTTVSAAWQNTDSTELTYSSRPIFDRINRQYVSVVTITNSGEEVIDGPVRILFDDASHELINANGEDNGVPYIELGELTLASGESEAVEVRLALNRAPLFFSLSSQLDVDEVAGSGLNLEPHQIAIFYSREDRQYENWGLHLWNGEGCGNYAGTTTESHHFGNWPDPYPADGIHGTYGAYFILTVEPGASCYNFIIHKGNEKALGDANSQFEPEYGEQVFTFHNYPELWYTAVANRPQVLDGARAHWMDNNTILWLTEDNNAASFAMYHSSDANLILDNAGASVLNFDELDVESKVAMQSAFAEQKHYDANPHLSRFSGFKLAVTDEQAKTLLTQQLIVVAQDDGGNVLDATRVQTPRILDYLYTAGENDADEAKLGITYRDNLITASVWAPSVQRISLNVYNKAKALQSKHNMTLDRDTGIWHFSGEKSDLDRQFYRYEVLVYHPATQQLELLETTDPYSVSLSTNGRYTQFVDLNDAGLKPVGWDEHLVPTVEDPEDIVVYESHIRDFSILDESTSPRHRGKYLAFTESNTVPVQHLQSLQASGLTHFHILPANDIATIPEDDARRVDVTDTVGRLCSLNSSSPVCGTESDSAVILDVLQSYAPSTVDAQALVDSMRGMDGFNWGYDPHHFAAPEGSYATDPDGATRILEMRAMNQALHEMGLRVVLDVVYNHTASSGIFDNAVLDKVVPGYYHRLSETTGRVENSTCCDNTATEHVMMAKLMNDSLVSFAQHFGVDSFRFDLMGHIPKQVVLNAREAVRNVDPDTYFYGEGWNFGEVANNRRFEQAAQLNMAGTEVGTFSDRLRDAVRSAALFNQGGSLHEQDTIRIGLVGNVGSYQFIAANGSYLSTFDYAWNGQPAGYSQDPADTVNYVSKHDNEALWDQLQYGLPEEMSSTDRVRVQSVALSIPLLSQGIPFLHMGSELIRSKSMDRNTFDAGDWFNRVDFTGVKSGWNIGLPLAQDNQGRWGEIRRVSSNTHINTSVSNRLLTASLFKEFLSIRATSKLFRLNSANDISQRIKFHNTGVGQTQGLVVMSLDDGIGLRDIDPNHDAMVVVFNGTQIQQDFTIDDAVAFELHSTQRNSADNRLRQSSFNNGTFSVPALTTAVFVKVQNSIQGFGLSALPPYGDRDIYLRGTMNGWSTSLPFEYGGDDQYEIKAELAAGQYEFKIADEHFGEANIGGGFEVPIGQSVNLSNGGNNLLLTITTQAQYSFTLVASDNSSPVLTITPDNPNAIPPPYGNTIIYVRGTMNGWDTSQPLSYEGSGIYSTTLSISEGLHEFKIAEANWSMPNLGGSNGTMVMGDTLGLVSDGSNIGLSINETQNLLIIVDASNPLMPTVSLRPVLP